MVSGRSGIQYTSGVDGERVRARQCHLRETDFTPIEQASKRESVVGRSDIGVCGSERKKVGGQYIGHQLCGSDWNKGSHWSVDRLPYTWDRLEESVSGQ